MAIRESDTHISGETAPGVINTPRPGETMREYLGLEVAHLLLGLDIAANQLRRGENAEALRTCSALVLLDPGEIRFQYALAGCALETGDFHLASLAASSIVAATPNEADGYFVSGRAYFGLREFDAAIDDFREAIRLAEQAGKSDLQRSAEMLLQRAIIAQEVQAKS